ncbi:MAG: hypothetical protein U5K75_08925 [Ahrensia sp.]|nr:hypothetical protein [Ahrensia sp.]
MMEACQTALTVADGGKHTRVEIAEGLMSFYVKSDGTECADAAPCECATAHIFAVNGGYLIEMLSSMGTDKGVIRLKDVGSPISIYPQVESATFITHDIVVMPMRV